MLLEHAGDGLRQRWPNRGGDDLLRVDGAMQVTELTFGAGSPTTGFEPALQHSGGPGPFWPILFGLVGGLYQQAERTALVEKAFNRRGVFGSDRIDEHLVFARVHA